MYKKILDDNLSPYMSRHPGVLFQQDNHPVHKSRALSKYFQEVGWRKLVWPPRSPDLSPIENVWGLLKQKISRETFEDIDELEDFIVNWWNSLNASYFRNLYESMPIRIQQVIDCDGNYIPY